MPDTESQTFNFKAETRQLLNILIHSLYKDREVFLRELISNASDALNRIRFELLTNRDVVDPDAELRIQIKLDKDARTLSVSDTGIGMTRDEIIENLGTIAQSGARKFIDAARAKNQDISQFIGQFGVGFYSVFMVAESVRVTSRSYQPQAQPVSWFATGEDRFEVSQAQKDERGTRVDIKLKEDALEFLEPFRLENIIEKHSDYVGFPIYIGDSTTPVNKQTSLWRSSRQDIQPQQYKDFYRQLTLEMDEPLHHIHMVTDAPVQLYALMFIPGKAERGLFSLRKDDGLKLYSRNILIDEYNKDLLPDYLRFIQGVVDSEDLPLNVSRETVQTSGLLPRLNKVLSNQVLKELENLARNEPQKYSIFWEGFGVYLKQGVATQQPEHEKLLPLLRFKTTTHPDTWVSLDDYLLRMKEGQKEIFYIIGEDPRSILHSPHLDYFTSQGIEVLLLTEPVDSFMLIGFSRYKDFELKNGAQAEIKSEQLLPDQPEAEKLTDPELDAIVERFKEVLGDRVADVRISLRLSQSVARLVDPEGALKPELQRVYRYLGQEAQMPKKVLELNPSHPILSGILNLDSGSDLQTIIIEQILDSAMLIEGLHPDPSSIAQRVQRLIQAALQSKS